jgi:hypothetical protein
MNAKKFSEEVGAEAGLDPITIINVAYMIISIAKAIYDCRNTNYAGIIKSAKNPGPFDKLLIQAKVRRHLKGTAYNRYGRRIADAIFRRAGALTEAELRAIVEEVQNG